ncbi:helix-turn-helix domain-containing protein [Streptosporangium algeriense]|uniref:Helix-turn-helix domain-containing protein n=1 Tax=Streptosporangium algeriense TaxID=1682748 RepID=A0ABW3DLC3_9ACTN
MEIPDLPLPDLLKYLRNAARMTQAEEAERLCEHTGTCTLTRHEVGRWEQGRVRPDAWLPALAEVLGVDLEILERAPSKKETTASYPVPSSYSGQEAEVSRWVTGKRSGQVSDIDVLLRVADGLQLPAAARHALGLAAGPAPSPRPTGPRLAICGSRAPGTDPRAIDSVVPHLARLLAVRPYRLNHGPVGIGIEIATYIADHYAPPGQGAAIGIFGHRNVIGDADLIVAIGGAAGTATELDLAITMRKPVIAIAACGGAAARFHAQAHTDPSLRPHLTDIQFAWLGEPAPGPHLTAIITELLEPAP